MPLKFSLKLTILIFLFFYCAKARAKSSENQTTDNLNPVENEMPKMSGGAALMFADELKQTLEKYLFGMCPQTFKFRWSQMVGKGRNATLPPCDLDPEQQDLAGRLAALSLRAHSVSRLECARFGTVLSNTLAELARTAANRPQFAGAQNDSLKKRKLSKSQKAKIQAKQRTALAVKKKAAAVAAAAAAKIAS